MSVSAFNQSVVNLPNGATPNLPGNAKGATVSAAVTVSATSGPSFSGVTSQSGPMFAAAPSMAQGSGGGALAAGSAGATGQGFFVSLKGFFSPAKPVIPGNPPPRPFPQKPDPVYSRFSHDELAQKLLNNFSVFSNKKEPSYITKQDLKDRAERSLTGYAHKDSNTRLAREILKRPDLLQALDRNGSTGGLDQKLTRQNIRDVILSDSPLKYKDDKELAKDLLKNFSRLEDKSWDQFWRREIKLDKIYQTAIKDLTGNPKKDELTYLAKELTNRSELLQKMDNTAGRDEDGRISWWGLRKLSR
ncbi:hypothetical protein [Pseudomonas gessardii]|uniref:hypothetical protein n=1 Tax=Pseudomonas gessardii TaxID=78544 RepID=UPI0014730B89|nr:hypothetical protein [Pseudomonas gessardii]NNA70349.1 hypothetical protein [Pseudomonas gessardii]